MGRFRRFSSSSVSADLSTDLPADVFQPAIAPTLSDKEVAGYIAMLKNDLVPLIPSFSQSVVVIGAGLAGLAAAREFKKAGMDVVILESDDRAGGRCYTMASPDFSKGVYGEAGGMRFPGSHKILMQYLDIFKLEKIPFTNMKDKDGLLYFDGVKTSIQEELKNPESLLSRVVAKWDESISELRHAWKERNLTWDDVISRYSKTSLLDFLKHEKCWSEELIEGFSKYGLGLGAYGSILDLSFIEILRLFIESYESGNYQLKNGMESLVKGFLLDKEYPLHTSVRYGCKVTSVHKQNDGRYQVSYYSQTAGSALSLGCDFVIPTVPLPNLSKISFDPPLAPSVQEAFEDSHYVRAVKIMIQTKSPFWLDQGIDGMVVSDLSIKNTYFAPRFTDSDKGLIVASYVWEGHADVFLKMSDKEKIQRAVDDLSQVFPNELPDQFERGAAVEWEQGFCIFHPGQMEKHHNTLRDEVCPNVFLAGEHCSVEHGYFEGALESGLRAAANVFRRIDHTFCARFGSILMYGKEQQDSVRCLLSTSNLMDNEDSNSVQSLDIDFEEDSEFPPDPLMLESSESSNSSNSSKDGKERRLSSQSRRGSTEGIERRRSSHSRRGSERRRSSHGSRRELSLPRIHSTTPLTDKQVLSPGLPVPVKRLDHYTLICDDAKAVADFHINVLQYKFLRIQEVNTGTVGPDDVDMINYILSPPANPDIVMVVTEGLNDDTIFRKYMKKYGQGVHHLAFEVNNVDQAFAEVKEAGVKTTSPHVTKDALSGLKQFFIEPSHAGFFIELIERPKKVVPPNNTPPKTEGNQNRGFFTKNNMAELARSISNLVSDDAGINADTNSSNQSGISTNEEQLPLGGKHEEPGRVVETLTKAMRNVKVGPIISMSVKVECPKSSANFLVRTLGFRLARFEGQDKICLKLPSSHGELSFVLKRASTPKEERGIMVSFALPELHRIKINQEAAGMFDPRDRDGSNNDTSGLHLPALYTSYDVELAYPKALRSIASIVRGCGAELYVDIGVDCQTVLSFLQEPTNLSKWTGHKAIHYSPTHEQWVETRLDSNGVLVDTVLKVDMIGMSRIKFEWPERKVSMRFECLEKDQHYCCLVAKFPTNMSEGRLASLKQLIGLELGVLKALLEGNEKRCISDKTWHRIQAYHLKIYGLSIENKISTDVLKEFPFDGEIQAGGDLLTQMSTDFAQTIYSKPQAVLRPNGIRDVQMAVKIASELGLKLSARGSQVSHSAGGQAQADKGLLLDMSTLASIEFVSVDESKNTFVKTGAGTMWNELIRLSLDRGLMPPVINDYQYLSVGGTISMGGVGFMSHQNGIQAGHVQELEVVTGHGDLTVCSSQQNKTLFDHCRGGLGQFGVVTSVTMPLVQAPKQICIFKAFYRQDQGEQFIRDVQHLVEYGCVEMIHSFLKPCKQTTISSIVGAEKYEASSSDFQDNVASGEGNGEVVFFLELGCYIWDEGDGRTNQLQDIKAHLSNSLTVMSDEMFEETLDFYKYITRDPPVVECNKAHGGSIPHPSFATIVDQEDTLDLLNLHLESDDRGDDSVNEILIIPMKSNAMLHSGHHVPMFPMPESTSKGDDSLAFFLLFLGSVVPNSTMSADECMNMIRRHHRVLYNHSMLVGGKRYSYDTVTNEVRGEALWKEHYGEYTWHKICSAKRTYDPEHILSPGVHMWDE